MKHTILILTLAIILVSCGSKPNKTIEKESVDILKSNTSDSMQSGIFIKDKSQYDVLFIKGLLLYNDTISLVDNYIVTGMDTTFFPEAIPLNNPMVFKAQKGNNTYWLTVTRTSFTNLAYQFKLSDNGGKVLYSKSGKAVLGSSFFLASEIDEDTDLGDNYASAEYWDNANDCWLSIRIAYELDAKGKLRAKLVYGCEDKTQPNLPLNDCPVLRAE